MNKDIDDINWWDAYPLTNEERTYLDDDIECERRRDAVQNAIHEAAKRDADWEKRYADFVSKHGTLALFFPNGHKWNDKMKPPPHERDYVSGPFVGSNITTDPYESQYEPPLEPSARVKIIILGLIIAWLLVCMAAYSA